MSGHAILSPSASKRWGSSKGCPASAARSVGIVSKSNAASRKGTAKHMVSAICLEKNLEPASFLGRLVVFVSEVDAPNKERECFAEDVNLDTVILQAEFQVDDEFISHCEIYVNYVREYVALCGGEMFVEQRLSIEHITKEKDAKGTTDALVITPKVLTVIDAKFGVGRVNAFDQVLRAVVNPVTGEITEPAVLEPNSQLAMYADAGLVEHAMFYDFERVTLIIVQPALKHVSEFSLSVPELKAYIEKLRAAADATRDPNAEFNPTSDNCFFCPARLTCAAREAFVLNAVLGDFDDLTFAEAKVVKANEIGDLYDKLGLIRGWCDDVEERVMAALDNGQVVRRADGLRYKLVSGKPGNRAWSDEQRALELMTEMRLKDSQMYTMNLISPTQAEKLATAPKVKKGETAEKPVIGPIRWNKLKALITRADGKPTVALETDPRNELHPAESLFDALPEEPVVAASTEQIVSDLFS
jgi:hypothetical protein